MQGWFCTQHNMYNDILTVSCMYCSESRPKSLDSLAAIIAVNRTGWFRNMSEIQRELHAEFYQRWNQEATDELAPMSDDDRIAWIRKLEYIALEAKVKLTRAYEIDRQKKAAKRPWLVSSDSDVSVEQSIKEVKQRQERMSKMDKANALLAGLIGVKDAASFINKNLKAVSDIKVVKSPSIEPKPESKPIDLDALSALLNKPKE